MYDKKLIIGTRGSGLAIKQAESVVDGLGSNLELDIELRIVKTRGDLFLDKPLSSFGKKGVFISGLNELILKNELDAAVHSMKDLPTSLPKKLAVAAVLPRASPLDVLVSDHGLKELPYNAVVGTSSTRRRAQILRLRRDLQVRDIRGNIDTRMRKLMDGGYDGIVVAKAGLERLYLGLDTVGTRSTVEDLPFITSAGQGAIAVVTRENSSAEDMIKPLDDWRSRMETDVERIIMGAFGGSCREPMGVMAKLKNDGIDVRAEVLSLDGTRCECLEKRIRIQNYKENAIRMGEELNYKKAGVLSTH